MLPSAHGYCASEDVYHGMFQLSAPYPQWHCYLPALHFQSGKLTCVPCRFKLHSSARLLTYVERHDIDVCPARSADHVAVSEAANLFPLEACCVAKSP